MSLKGIVHPYIDIYSCPLSCGSLILLGRPTSAEADMGGVGMVAAHAVAIDNQYGSGVLGMHHADDAGVKHTSGWRHGKGNRGRADPPCSCGETSP